MIYLHYCCCWLSIRWSTWIVHLLIMETFIMITMRAKFVVRYANSESHNSSSLILKIAQFRRIFWQIPSWCGGLHCLVPLGVINTECLLLPPQNSAFLLKVQLCSHLNTSVTHWDPINGVSITTPYRGIRVSTRSAHQELYSSSRLFFSFLWFLFCFSSINNWKKVFKIKNIFLYWIIITFLRNCTTWHFVAWAGVLVLKLFNNNSSNDNNNNKLWFNSTVQMN